jgi:LysR family cyn operon transcriptional activator
MLLRHIRYLLAVAEQGNFSRAAEVLHVSQPTLSQQIKQLEEELGAELLDRSGRSVRPTAAGAAYIEHARKMLLELAAGKRAIHDVQDLSRGTLRLALTPTFIPYLAGPLIRNFTARYPDIHLTVLERSLNDIESELAEDSIDIAIAFDTVRNPDIECLPLLVETLGLMVGKHHPFYARNKTWVAPPQLSEQPLVLLTKDFITRTCIEEYFREHEVKPKVVMETNSVAAILEILRHAPMATILPEAIASEERGLRCYQLKGYPPQRTAALLRRRHGYQSAAALAFAQMAEAWCVDNLGGQEI